MERAGAPFHRQASRLVRVIVAALKDHDGNDVLSPAVEPVPLPAIQRALTQCASFRKYDGRSKRDVDTEPPKAIAEQINNMNNEWRFPSIRGISATPTMRPDGSLLTAPGYDPDTGLFLFNPPPMPPIPAKPSKDQARKALDLLARLLPEFPFGGDNPAVSRAGALSLLITAVLRGTMDIAPMHFVDKPAPGTGGSYLIDIAAAIMLGTRAPVISWAPKAEENEKRLIGAAAMQLPLIALDNVTGRLTGDFLCQLTERPLLICRLLGGSILTGVSNSALTVVNGNNVELALDQVRRTIRIIIDASMEDPTKRRFTGDPLGDIAQDRGKYIAAILTMVRAFIVAGSPGQLAPYPSYKLWSNRVRSALVWLGEADPVLSISQSQAQDPIVAQRTAVFDAWASELELGQGYRPSELITATAEWLPNNGGKARPKLREALLEVAADRRDNTNINPERLGLWLKRHLNTVAGGHKLRGDFSNKATPRYLLITAMGGTQDAQEPQANGDDNDDDYGYR
jgi:putative DNA primase/helicase